MHTVYIPIPYPKPVPNPQNPSSEIHNETSFLRFCRSGRAKETLKNDSGGTNVHDNTRRPVALNSSRLLPSWVVLNTKNRSGKNRVPNRGDTNMIQANLRTSLQKSQKQRRQRLSATNHNQPRSAKMPRTIVPPPQSARIMQRYVGGESIRQIAREEQRDRATITKIVRSDEMQVFVQKMRERFYGFTFDAIELCRALLETAKRSPLSLSDALRYRNRSVSRRKTIQSPHSLLASTNPQ